MNVAVAILRYVGGMLILAWLGSQLVKAAMWLFPALPLPRLWSEHRTIILVFAAYIFLGGLAYVIRDAIYKGRLETDLQNRPQDIDVR
ncbi:MAG: hypothetical protein QOH88_1408 [Verrucomicrobiota bacterium]|jgi:hypothetical protein